MNVERALRVLLINRWLAWVLVVPLLGLVAMTTLQYRSIEAETGAELGKAGSLLIAGKAVSQARILNDYEDFYVVGRLYREGDIVSAYDNDYLTQAQKRFTGSTTFMPWAYPPQLTAAVPLLPMMGLSLSYLLFMTGTLALFVGVLSRFGARLTGAAMLAIYPALVLVVRLGQNGALSGALIGLFVLGLMRGRKAAGIPLGLMAIKPHLAVALGLLALLQRRWAMIAIAAAVVLASCIAGTLVLGFRVWPAFFSGVSAAGGYLREGLFPLYRMSSVYAGLRSFGLTPDSAMAGHVLMAVAALGAVFAAWRVGMRANRLAALTCLATLFVSPYNYDYDLVCLAVSMALILPEFLARCRPAELVLLYLLAWVGTGAGLAQHFRAVLFVGTTEHPHGSSLNWSLQGAGVLLAALLVTVVLQRRPKMVAMDTGAGDAPLEQARGAW